MVGSNIEERLEAYRRKKRREEMAESVKNVIRTVLPWKENKSEQESSLEQLIERQDDQDTESICTDDNVSQSYPFLKIVSYLLYFLLWTTVYIIAIEYDFGTVYFIITALMFICINTRSKPKRPGEISAYSVFNDNCEPIEGTLDASQFEREIRYGMGSVP